MACKERYTYGATTHISFSMQSCLSYRAPNGAERFIYVGDGNLGEVVIKDWNLYGFERDFLL